MRNKNSQSMKHKQMFASQRKLFVVGLPQNVERSELNIFFQKYGEIEYSNVITEQVIDKPRSNRNLTNLYIYRIRIYCI